MQANQTQAAQCQNPCQKRSSKEECSSGGLDHHLLHCQIHVNKRFLHILTDPFHSYIIWRQAGHSDGVKRNTGFTRLLYFCLQDLLLPQGREDALFLPQASFSYMWALRTSALSPAFRSRPCREQECPLQASTKYKAHLQTRLPFKGGGGLLYMLTSSGTHRLNDTSSTPY